MKDIKDYLHLYLGCEVFVNISQKKKSFLVGKGISGNWIIEFRNAGKPNFIELTNKFKPILRPLSDMTEDETKERDATMVFQRATPVHVVGSMVATAETFRYLLSKHFDLFNLIPSGLAIDSTKVK